VPQKSIGRFFLAPQARRLTIHAKSGRERGPRNGVERVKTGRQGIYSPPFVKTAKDRAPDCVVTKGKTNSTLRHPAIISILQNLGSCLRSERLGRLQKAASTSLSEQGEANSWLGHRTIYSGLVNSQGVDVCGPSGSH
jgi:hypothetical protein